MRMTALAILAALGATVLAGTANATVVLNPGAVEEGYPAATGPSCPAGTAWHEAEYYQKDQNTRPAGCYAD